MTAEFEAWWLDHNGIDVGSADEKVLLGKQDNGRYRMVTSAYAWDAWQAARAAHPPVQPTEPGMTPLERLGNDLLDGKVQPTVTDEEVEAMCKELEGYLHCPTDDDDRPTGPVGPDPLTSRAAALIREQAARVEEIHFALERTSGLLDEAERAIDKQAAEKVETAREYIEAMTTMRAQIAAYKAAIELIPEDVEGYLEAFSDAIAAIAAEKLDAYMNEYRPGEIANND